MRTRVVSNSNFFPGAYPNNRLLNYVLSQRYTIDMALTIFGLSRRANTPNRAHQFDKVIVRIIVEVMTTQPTNKPGRLLFWQHLHYLFVHLLIYQFIKIGDVMSLLRVELSKVGDHNLQICFAVPLSNTSAKLSRQIYDL